MKNARLSYEAAEKKNPTNPTIELALARLEAGQGMYNFTSDHLTQALKLKPTIPMLFVVVQLDVLITTFQAQHGRHKQRAMRRLAWTYSGFQLGLLY